MNRPRLASVVIPAHDEQQTLGRCLAELMREGEAGELDVVVVANACTDGTARVAKEAGAKVIETPVAGKANALRLGDSACRGFPRLYLDADVIVDIASVRAMAAALAEDGVLACAPVARIDFDASGPVVRRVHRVHEALIGPQRGLAGVGLYALSERGHARVFPLPDVLADDEWVHRSFSAEERRVVAGARTTVRPAPTLRAHLRRRARVRLGNCQLTAVGKHRQAQPNRLAQLSRLVRTGSVGPVDAACYTAVIALERLRFLLSSKTRASAAGWSPDRSS